MLDVYSLSVSYGKHKALENAGVRVDRGEIVVILGANGAGKSTMLKAISGICEGKVTGTITMQGQELVGVAPNKIVEAGIALVPEGRGVFADLSVQENLRLGAYGHRARDDEEANLSRVLQLFPKLGERRRQIVRTMSGGEQQMVAIGRAMMSSPAILTLDEPSLGLSPLLCKELFQNLSVVRDAGIGILLVEQNAKQSLAIADRGYLIENGHIVHEAPAKDLMNDPAVQKAYLGGASGTPAAAPRPASPAVSTPPAAKPAGQSPADIAAAAMQKFTPRPMSQAPAAAAPPPPRPTPPQPKVAPVHPTAAPTPRVTHGSGTRSADDVLGVNLSELVARASTSSAGQVSPRDSQPTAPASFQRKYETRHTTKMPDLSDSHDRLKAALAEIEEAAARARAYRPNTKS